MPLFDIPVVIPYRLDDDDSGALYPVQVHAVASGTPAALATSEVLANTMGRLRHPGHGIVVEKDRAKVGTVGKQVEGPYAYIFTRGSFVHHLAFPARIDSQAGEQLTESLSAFSSKDIYGLVMDCAPMVYINTIGLTALSAHAEHLHLFRLPTAITKVFEIVGLDRMVHLHAGLTKALDGLVAGQPTPPAPASTDNGSPPPPR